MADGSEVSRSVAKTVCYATNGLKTEEVKADNLKCRMAEGEENAEMRKTETPKIADGG